MPLKNQSLVRMIHRLGKAQERLLADAYRKWSGEKPRGLQGHIKLIDNALHFNRTLDAGIV